MVGPIETGTCRAGGAAAGSTGWRFRRHIALLVLALILASGRSLSAQARELENSGTGRISGRVVDAESLTPLGGVVVRLERALRPDGPGEVVRSTVTDSTGAYEFDGLRSGYFRLLVERIGYLARSVDVELMDGGRPLVAVGLEVGPVLLPPLRIQGTRPQPFVSTEHLEADGIGARAMVDRRRQEEFIVGDARQITRAEVVEAITLGEMDIFRALQRTPGVSTRDDFTATVWTRGATWDQTRVFFDGLPLYNPTHAGWLFSAVNPDAVGEVAFFPGHRSARWGEGAAAVLSLRSRMGGMSEGMRGLGEISPASARLTLDGAAADDRLRWMVAARRTYVDLLSEMVAEFVGDDEIGVPYDFTDLIGRVDLRLFGDVTLDASTILEWDRLRGDIPGLLRGNRGRWGNQAGQMGVTAPLGPVEVHVMAGRTRFGTSMLEDPDRVAGPGEVTIPALENAIRHDRAGVEVRPGQGDPGRWAVGYQAVRERVSYTGPFSLLGVLISAIPRDPTAEPSRLSYRLDYSALWGERRWDLGRLSVTTGLRGEFGDSLANGGRLRLAPRVGTRLELDGATILSAGWARSFQYTQDIAATAGPIGPQLHLSAVWALAQQGSNYPVARADVRTVSLERWIGEAVLGSVTVYDRFASGIMIPNPDSGTVTASRDPDAIANNEASGLEISLKKLSGRWTGSIGYSYGDSRFQRIPGEDEPDAHAVGFPSSADVRHALDLTGMLRLGRAWRAGAAFTYASGVPFTRLVLPDTTLAEPPRPRVGAPNAQRTPSYASLDLMFDYSTTVGSWQVGAYAQLRNALNRDNAVTYSGSLQCGESAQTRTMGATWPRDIRCGDAVGIRDFFDSGVPRLPLIGVRVSF